MEEQDFKIYCFYEQLYALMNNAQLSSGELKLILETVLSEINDLYIKNINNYMYKNKIIEERKIPFQNSIPINPLTGEIDSEKHELKIDANNPELKKQTTQVQFKTLKESGQE